jgi:peptidoglycan/LPS O-acetylase OafA/YrhL
MRHAARKVPDREPQLSQPEPEGGSQLKRPKQHWPALDGLRAIAVLAVMIYHVGVLPGGYLGVDVFFVLSGFLITWLLIGEWEKRGRISFRDFYVRRALRLFPALGCVIAVAVIFAGLMELAGRPSYRPYSLGTFEGLPWVVTFVGNWARALDPSSLAGSLGLLGHTWSLGVEEQFYLLWPALFVLLMRRHFSRGRLAFFLALTAIAEMIYRLAGTLAGDNSSRIYYGTDTHSDGLIIGCAVAFWLASGRSSGRQVPSGLLKGATWVGTAVLALLFLLGDRSDAPVEVSVAVLAAGAVLVGVVTGKVPAAVGGLLSSPHAVLIGRRSYGLYLWQYVILQAVVALYPATALDGRRISVAVTLGAVFAAPFIAAELSYRFVELPALRLKRLFRGQQITRSPLPGRDRDISLMAPPASAGRRPADAATDRAASWPAATVPAAEDGAGPTGGR